MAVDETILEVVGRGDSPPVLRLYAWDPPCLSLGYAQPFMDAETARLVERGWDIVRRPTGGRAILHTDELTYAVIAPSSEPLLAGGVLQSYQRLGQALLAAFKELGLPVEMKAQEEGMTRNRNPVCFEVPSTCEIMMNGRKLVGSAQSRRREGVLQHGSIPLKGDLRRIVQVLHFRSENERSQAADRLTDHAVTVEEALHHTVTWDSVAHALIGAFNRVHSLEFHENPLSPLEESRATELVEKKHAHPAWLNRV